MWKATAPGGAEAAVKIIRLGSREGRKELRALQLVKRIHHTHLVPIIAFWIKNDKGEILDDEAVLLARRSWRERRRLPRVTAAPTAPLDPFAETAAVDGPAELIIAMGLGDQSLFDRLEHCRGTRGFAHGIPDDESFSAISKTAPKKRSTTSTARSTTSAQGQPPSSIATSSRTQPSPRGRLGTGLRLRPGADDGH